MPTVAAAPTALALQPERTIAQADPTTGTSQDSGRPAGTEAATTPAAPPDTQLATPSDTATASAPPTATPTPLPTATPTATTPPSQQLAEAIRLQDDGDYGAARTLLASLIRDDPQAREAHEARWRLGQAYWQDGEPIEAALALTLAHQLVPAGLLPPQVDFWLAESLAALGQHQAAADAYGRYLQQEDPLAAEITLRTGRQLRQAGDPEGAIAALKELQAIAPDNRLRFAAAEELASIYVELENPDAALAELDGILALSQWNRYRAEIQYRSGQALAQAGRQEDAIARYRQVLVEDESSPFALEAIDALLSQQQPVDDYTRGRVLLANDRITEGISYVYAYLEAVPDHPAAPHLLVAEAYFSQRNYDAALAEWRKLLDTHPEYDDWAGVSLRMATAQGRLGNRQAARDLYAEVAARSAARAATARLEAARLAENDDDYRTAATEYLDLARLLPTAAEAGEALYRAGLCQYRLDQPSSALETWQQLLTAYPSNLYAHAGRYWAGKVQLEQGQGQDALQTWQPLVTEAGDSYYTARAAELAQEAGLVLQNNEGAGSTAEITAEIQATGVSTPALEPGASSPQAASQAEAEAWLAAWAAQDVADPAVLAALPATVAADEQLARAEAYLRLELRAEALGELDAVRQRYQDDPLAMYALALHFRQLGAYRHATLCAVRLGALAPGGLFAAPRFVQQLAYPTYFANLVEAEAASRGLDPLLIYALIRQESFFERGARSFAAAQGLTQVIPSTAEWIAEAIGWSDFRSDDIYKPYINVKFGTYYLWAALEMFDGDLYSALVGYNAGPGNARYWRERTPGNDPELFVEEITLSEPKLYVRRVLAHYSIYRRLYN